MGFYHHFTPLTFKTTNDRWHIKRHLWDCLKSQFFQLPHKRNSKMQSWVTKRWKKKKHSGIAWWMIRSQGTLWIYPYDHEITCSQATRTQYPGRSLVAMVGVEMWEDSRAEHCLVFCSWNLNASKENRKEVIVGLLHGCLNQTRLT